MESAVERTVSTEIGYIARWRRWIDVGFGGVFENEISVVIFLNDFATQSGTAYHALMDVGDIDRSAGATDLFPG